MKKLIFTLLALTAFALNSALAQSGGSEEVILDNLRAKSIGTTAAGGNIATTYQEGGANVSMVQQVQTSTVANQVNVLQVGSFNQAALQQTGAGIRATVNQFGNYNSFESSMTGANLTSNVVQLGNGNSITQQVQGSNLNYGLLQYGDNNTINQIETSPGSRSYKVVQEGNNMNITIEQSAGFVPVTVRQQ
ncbi:minor curlin subunit [Pontibacter mucosus]|uniref:Minor curlin subunit n=1 Tax=Pontibacter mucosus TaxID=1649266 RepID=A0A2T5YPI7_9BACT|nr:hypothetical protein [Pontibacter mucosus]PTX21228.1 minor curlin subunit [Pontibacter mucosus]